MSEPLESIRAALGDRYRIDRMIGEGGMATVWLAQDLRHNRPVALKLLRPELAQAIGTDRFVREIEVAARLNHPHILPLLDSGTVELGPGWPACPYYVMPFVEGETLRVRIVREGTLTEPEALRIAREVAEGLDHAHRNGVLHRDIKPENILLSEGHAVIADFGIARAVDEAGGAPLTRTGQALGTPTYMSPEQITGDSAIDGRSDLFALGCVLYEMLAGTPPWSSATVSGTLARRLAEDAPSPRSVNPAISASASAVVERAIAREPRHRFDTPGELATVIASLVTGETVRIRRLSRGTNVRRGLLGVAVVVLVAVLALVQTDQRRTITSIAILPMAAASDSTTNHLAEGIHEGVADLLRRMPMLRVTAPSLVTQVIAARPSLTSEELGREVRVEAVLAWNLRRSGDSLQLRAELIGIPGGALLWRARYDRELTDLPSLQGEVARTITDSLQLRLTGAEREVLTRLPTTSAQAYELYLRGRRFYNLATPLGAALAGEYLDSALHYADRGLEEDSSFASAWALKGAYYFLSTVRGFHADFGAGMDSASAYGSRALALDSTLGEPWMDRVVHALYLQDNWETARTLIRRSLAASPWFPGLYQYAAIYVGEIEGRIDSAITLMRHSAELEPIALTLNSLGDLYMRARQHDSAIAVLRRSLGIDPTPPGPNQRLIQTYERTGRYAEAVTALRSWKGEAAAAPFARALEADGPAGYRRVLEQDIRRRIDSLESLVGRPRRGSVDTLPPTLEARIAPLYAQLGEWSRAMDWVLRDRERRPKRFRLYVTNPDFDGLRADPRFLPLVRAEGLEPLLQRRSR
jgi:serine/threonine-protein kinase